MVAKCKESGAVQIGALTVENSDKRPEMNRFNAALRQVLSVSKPDLNRLLADEKASKAGKVKPGPKSKTADC